MRVQAYDPNKEAESTVHLRLKQTTPSRVIVEVVDEDGKRRTSGSMLEISPKRVRVIGGFGDFGIARTEFGVEVNS